MKSHNYGRTHVNENNCYLQMGLNAKDIDY